MPPEMRRRRNELVRRVQRVDDVAGVFAEASSRLRRLVPFDAAVWVSTDPATGLATAPTLADNIDTHNSDRCSSYWHREVLNEDVNLFRDLARAEVPAAALRSTTGDPGRSARYRKFLRPVGVEDELRAVLRVDESPWATVTLMRNEGRPPFSRVETSLVASLSAPLGEVLRVRARPSGSTEGFTGKERPGLLLFDGDGVLESANEEARVWLAELPPDLGRPSDLDLQVPLWISIAVFHAQGSEDATARARVRTRRGRWLVCHASSLRDASGEPGNTAVVIEPAKSSEMAPIIAQAYDLTEREQQVTSLIARGAGTAEIAEELFLSTHTIRDHVKTIFQKVGVTSRGELVARLFAEHYGPEHHHDLISVFDD
jgi:DNA-binding CsgD family transcriptional regulator